MALLNTPDGKNTAVIETLPPSANNSTEEWSIKTCSLTVLFVEILFAALLLVKDGENDVLPALDLSM